VPPGTYSVKEAGTTSGGWKVGYVGVGTTTFSCGYGLAGSGCFTVGAGDSVSISISLVPSCERDTSCDNQCAGNGVGYSNGDGNCYYDDQCTKRCCGEHYNFKEKRLQL